MQYFTTFNIGILKDFILSLSSFSLAFGIVLKYDSETRVSLSLGVFLTILGFIFFISMTSLINKILLSTSLGYNFIKRKHLSISDCVDITNKLISALQAILSCAFGFLICAHSCRKNFLTTSHIFSEAYAFFGSAYFIYDIWSMFVVYVTKIYDSLSMKDINSTKTGDDLTEIIPSMDNGELHIYRNIVVKNKEIPSFLDYAKRSKLMIFHHMFIGSYGLVVISSWRGGLGDCVFSFFFMMEFSTPFVSFRAILSILKMKETKLYVINGLLMIVTFLCFRIIMLPMLMLKYSYAIQLPLFDAVMKLPTMCQVSILALFLPQFYWFTLMIKIALKMFQPSSQQEKINHKVKDK